MSNKYTSEDYIRDVIESGTAYECVRLLATSVAHWAYQNEPIEPPLTPEEHSQLQAPFRSLGCGLRAGFHEAALPLSIRGVTP